jgi:hypothetical protein
MTPATQTLRKLERHGSLEQSWCSPKIGMAIPGRPGMRRPVHRLGASGAPCCYHEQDDKKPRSGGAGEMGLGAYDYEAMRPTSKGSVENVLQSRPRLVRRGSGGPGGGAPRSQIVREAARQDGGPISSRSGRRGPEPGEGPQHRPLGLGGGAGSQWAEGNGWPASSWVGASVWSTEWRRRVGQKVERGREVRDGR